MQAPFDNIVQHLFHQPSLHSVTVDELEHMAEEHPYFAAAHFLLLKKMQDTSHPAFTDQLHKTTIYFNNPLWLQFLLQPESVTNFSVSETPPFINSEPTEQSTVTADENSNDHISAAPVMETDETIVHAPVAEAPPEHTDNNTDQSSLHHANHGIAPSENNGMMNVITEVFSDPNPLYDLPSFETTDSAATEEVPAQPAEAATEQVENIISGTASEPEQSFIRENNEVSGEIETPADTELPAAAFIAEEPAMADGEKLIENVAETAWENNHHTIETTVISEEPVQNPGENITAETTVTEINHSDNQAATIIPEQASESNSENDSEGTIEADATEPVAEITMDHNRTDETPPGKEESFLLKTIIETPAAKNDLLFEPYHTVDYFASQGIKLSKAEADSKDKLGRQLKSFTEWLKTMKKLPQVSINKILAENEESKVVEDANHSIEPKEVITEAMAEVFEKQGMHEKAAEVYRKLSLLNPPKSAYFAARIEALKL